jgi:hypothetical protein
MAARGWQQTSSGTVLFITAGVGAQHAQDGTGKTIATATVTKKFPPV